MERISCLWALGLYSWLSPPSPTLYQAPSSRNMHKSQNTHTALGKLRIKTGGIRNAERVSIGIEVIVDSSAPST